MRQKIANGWNPRPVSRLTAAFAVLAIFLFGSVPAEIISANEPNNHHLLGAAAENGGWAAASDLGSGFLTYGPYTANYQDGVFRASFRLGVDDISSDDLSVAAIDVYDNVKNEEVARREIHRKEFDAPRALQMFDLSFVTSGPNNLEFRVFVFGHSYVVHESTTIIRLSSFLAGDPIPANARTSEHGLGLQGSGSSWIAEPQQGKGFLTLTPMPSLIAGNYVAKFAVRVEGRPPQRQLTNKVDIAATLDVYNRSTRAALAQLQIANEAYPAKIETMELPFSYDGVGELEWRVYTHGTSRLEHFSSSVSAEMPMSYDGNDPALLHGLGSPKKTAWTTNEASARGYLTYGPHATNLPPGISTATFNLTAGSIRAPNDEIAILDVYDDDEGTTLARRIVKGVDFTAGSARQDFDLVFETSKQTSLQFRVFATGGGLLQHNSTIIRPDRLSLAALWNQKAHFEFRKRDYFVDAKFHDNDTSSLITLDGKWYAFNRQEALLPSQPQTDACRKANRPPLQVVVRASTDRGVSWTDPVIVVRPNRVASSAEGCEVVDGGAFFDMERDVWHYLGQCIGANGGWSLCHYTRSGISPMGSFDPDRSNPVVTGGALWSRICAGSGKSCSADMTDEGTPQIVAKTSDGFFYVTFHGARYGTPITGARGVARTLDFQHWQALGGGLPEDAILASRDCSNWRIDWANGGCIGVGASRILRSAGQFYQIAEAADRSLLCQPDQNWVFGLFRNARIGAAGTWENYADNPFVVNRNTSPIGCALQYMNLYRDRGEIYLEFSLYTPEYAYPNYTYQLVAGEGTSNTLRAK